MRTRETIIVVVAEHDLLVRTLVSEFLEEFGGFEVWSVASMEEALGVIGIAERPVKALVTCRSMGGALDGLELARIVAKGWPHIGIVIVSTLPKSDLTNLPEGSVVRQPFDRIALGDAVVSAVEAKWSPRDPWWPAARPYKSQVSPSRLSLLHPLEL